MYTFSFMHPLLISVLHLHSHLHPCISRYLSLVPYLLILWLTAGAGKWRNWTSLLALVPSHLAAHSYRTNRCVWHVCEVFAWQEGGRWSSLSSTI
ncbi:hypothetical protein BD779DRAFT_1537252, partial [Infundibulicybe gibba]